MALPIVPLASATVEIGGVDVQYHAMSRAQALQLQAFQGLPAEAEVHILMSGTGCTDEEACAFREATDTATAGSLIDAILIISGLTEGPKA